MIQPQARRQTGKKDVVPLLIVALALIGTAAAVTLALSKGAK
jgi:hypothetical protein